MAGAVGVAIGPALGGLLTQLFDWRAIFFVQAPVAAAALAVAADPAARALQREGHLHGQPTTRRRDVVVANIGFALVFAALVGALFLGVLLAIEVWRYSPIQGAALVSALPVGMAVGRTMKSAPKPLVAGGGALLLALGLLGLALLPGEQAVMAAVAFALCGAGFDLVHEVLDSAAVPADGPAVQASAVSIGARHAGLVVGLILIAPVLSASLEDAIDRATLGATRTMLETELPLSDKLPVTWALRTAIEEAPRGQVPDLAAEFDERGAEGDNAMARARDDLMDTVTDAVTRSFRPAFGVAALLAALAAIPALVVAFAAPRAHAGSVRRRELSTLGVGALGLAGLALLGAELASGARDVGEYVAADPCAAGPDPFPGDGLDASVQRIALSALNGAACELGHDARAARALDRPRQRLRRRHVGRRDRRGGAARRRPASDRRRRRTRFDPRFRGHDPALRGRPGADRVARRAAPAPRLKSPFCPQPRMAILPGRATYVSRRRGRRRRSARSGGRAPRHAGRADPPPPARS